MLVGDTDLDSVNSNIVLADKLRKDYAWCLKRVIGIRCEGGQFGDGDPNLILNVHVKNHGEYEWWELVRCLIQFIQVQKDYWL